MIHNAHDDLSNLSLGDLLDIFEDGSHPALFGGLFNHRRSDAEAARRKNLETIRSNEALMATQLDIAARRVLLTARHDVSVRYFDALTAEMDIFRRLVERTEALAPDASVTEANTLGKEVNAWTRRIRALVSASDDEHTRTMWANSFTDLYVMHHRAFEHHISHMLTFDGFAVERWNGGAGDLAADVIARLPAPDGRPAIVQCKHVQDFDTTSLAVVATACRWLLLHGVRRLRPRTHRDLRRSCRNSRPRRRRRRSALPVGVRPGVRIG
ncbi:restriction endonuclease [Streptomyces sp. FXJ1.172]|uniref:restriction endonuclease n=1 Tax=Streptomyces sp. FXJ1.172 TaxID=710705 RepID=UPI0007CF6985|nr:restriction endonuclease [Streptomyces sp. FXJ1.172]WEO92829.1 restriction endonuclease [Streptomyces sp. FXJ1.172]